MHKQGILTLIVILPLLAACGPSQAEHDAAVATQVALLIQQEQAGAGDNGGAEAGAGAEAQPTAATNTGDAAPTPDMRLPSIAACIPDDSERVIATVTDVWDGDSIQVLINGESFEVRYIGLDAADGDTAALEANRQLVEGKQVLLVRDVSDTDQFGRLSRFVIVDRTFVNYELIHKGVVIPEPEEPDLDCMDFFDRAQP